MYGTIEDDSMQDISVELPTYFMLEVDSQRAKCSY